MSIINAGRRRDLRKPGAVDVDAGRGSGGKSSARTGTPDAGSFRSVEVEPYRIPRACSSCIGMMRKRFSFFVCSPTTTRLSRDSRS